MSATDITFFATVATVIPAFLVAYVVGVQKTMVALADEYSDSTDAYLQGLRDSLEKEEGRLHSVLRAIGASIRATVVQIASLGLFVVAVGMPAAAEYVSLHSLYVDHATSSAKTISLLGALVAGTVVVAPLVVSMLRAYDPFGLSIGLIRVFIGQVKSQYGDAKQNQQPAKSPSEDAAGDTCGDG